MPYINLMEYLNGTRPDSNDSDRCCYFQHNTEFRQVVSHDRDWNLSDGREVFNMEQPMDNDTDGDMLLIGMSTKKA